MKEFFGNMWNMEADAICITITGATGYDGEALTGSGSATDARKFYPQYPANLTHHLKSNGNELAIVARDALTHLISFPIKPRAFILDCLSELAPPHRNSHRVHELVPGIHGLPRLSTIRDSALALRGLADREGYKSVVLPRVGCGNMSRLDYKLDVRPMLEEILDDRFTVVSFKYD